MPSQIPLNHNTIKNLKDFYAPQPHLFQDAIELPQFFSTNLVDDSRVVKYFPQDPQANLRIFYYQYLKLCFEIDNVDYESYIEKIYELIRTQGFQFYFDSNDHQKQYKNAQYKSLLVDFFDIMNSSSLTIDQVLTQYPILDDVFINFFRSVLMIASVTNEFDSYIDKNELFDFLSSFFSVDISSYDKCLKFVESDIFVYEQDPENIYMAYIKDDEDEDEQQENQNEQQNNSIQRINQTNNSCRFAMDSKGFTISEEVSEKTIPQENINPIGVPSQFAQNQSKPKAKLMIKQSYIEGQFADYTSYHSKGISAFGKNLTSESQKHIPSTVQHNTTFIDNQTTQTNIQQLSEIRIDKQRKRILSAENQSKFSIDPAYNQHQFSQRLTSHHSNKPKSNQLSVQNNQTLIESLYVQNEGTIANLQSKEHMENQDLTNSKDNSKKQIGFNRNHLYQTYQEPTKDPGFSNPQTVNVHPVQLTIYHEIKPKSMAVSHQSRNSMDNEKLSYIPEPLFHKPSIQIPTLLNPNTLSQNSRMVTSSKLMKDSQSSGAVNNLAVGFIRQNFKLNVTKQFTNSFVMKSMNEPFKSNVYKIRDRARQFRKNIYQEFNYQSRNNPSSNEYQMSKNSSSKTNFPSSSTLEKQSSNNLAIESNAKAQSIKHITYEEKLKAQLKIESQYNNNQLSKKLFQVKDPTPSVNQKSQKHQIPISNEQNNTVKETLHQNKAQNKFGPVPSTGPSIVVSKQNQTQIYQYSQISQVQQGAFPPGNNLNQHQMPQQNAYKVMNQNSYQMMSKPPSYNYGKVPQNPSMHYTNKLQSMQPTKVYNQQGNNGVYGNGSKGQIQRGVNGQEIMYNQPINKPVPVFVAYERRT